MCAFLLSSWRIHRCSLVRPCFSTCTQQLVLSLMLNNFQTKDTHDAHPTSFLSYLSTPFLSFSLHTHKNMSTCHFLSLNMSLFFPHKIRVVQVFWEGPIWNTQMHSHSHRTHHFKRLLLMTTQQRQTMNIHPPAWTTRSICPTPSLYSLNPSSQHYWGLVVIRNPCEIKLNFKLQAKPNCQYLLTNRLLNFFLNCLSGEVNQLHHQQQHSWCVWVHVKKFQANFLQALSCSSSPKRRRFYKFDFCLKLWISWASPTNQP
jgi:hypothetical protein